MQIFLSLNLYCVLPVPVWLHFYWLIYGYNPASALFHHDKYPDDSSSHLLPGQTTHLGGDDFDQRVIDWMADAFQNENGIDLRKDKMAAQRLKEPAEKAKIELSSAMSSQINLPFITADATGPKHLDMTLTRAKFNELTADLVDRTMTPVRKALQDAGLRPSDLKSNS